MLNRPCGFRVAFLKDKPHCFRKLAPNTTWLSLPLPVLRGACLNTLGWDFLLVICRAFWREMGAEQDVVLLGDLNHGGLHSTLSFPMALHVLSLKILFLLLFPGASPLYLYITELYKSTNERSPLSPGGAALWFAVVLCCVLCGIMLLCK